MCFRKEKKIHLKQAGEIIHVVQTLSYTHKKCVSFDVVRRQNMATAKATCHALQTLVMKTHMQDSKNVTNLNKLQSQTEPRKWQ